MGVWGTGIFDSDEAVDVRSNFTDLIGQGEDPQAASDKIINQFCFGDLDEVDNNRIILALAATEHSLGIYDRVTFERSLAIEDSPEEIEYWEAEDRPRRKRMLSALRKKLEGPLPARKVVKPRKFKDTPLSVGEHYLFTDEKTNSKLLLRVVGHKSYKEGRYPRVTALNWDGGDEGLHNAGALSPLLQDTPLFPDQKYVGALLVAGRVKRENLVKLPTRVEVSSDRVYGQHFMRWDALVEHVRNMAIHIPPTLRITD